MAHEYFKVGTTQALINAVKARIINKPDGSAYAPDLTAGAALGITGEATDSAVWLQRTSASDGPTTIRSIHGNTIVQNGELLPVNMTGIESTGKNLWNKSVVAQKGYLDANGTFVSQAVWRVSDYIPVIAGSTVTISGGTVDGTTKNCWYNGNKEFISSFAATNGTATAPNGAQYLRISLRDFTLDGVQVEYGSVATTYEPYWHQTRTIPAGTLRSAGTVYDELTETERITRIGEVDLGTLTWAYQTSTGLFYSGAYNLMKSNTVNGIAGNGYALVASTTTAQATDKSLAKDSNGRIYIHDSAYTDAAAFKTAMSGVMLHYELATPTVTTIDPPLNMTYRTEQGGTERVMVPTGELSAPPTIVTAQGYTAESLRDAALSTIAPVENGLASTNYAVGSYLVHGGQLCKVTTAIATGESISIGTNVTATTVMAEVLSLTQ